MIATRTQTVVLAWIYAAGSTGITEAELKRYANLVWPLNCLRAFLKRGLIEKAGAHYRLRRSKAARRDAVALLDESLKAHGLKRRPKGAQSSKRLDAARAA